MLSKARPRPSKKGYEYGIRAFELLTRSGQYKDFVYVIIGDDTNKLERLVKDLSLTGKVFLLPSKDRETIVECYRSSWCFFSPSIVEGLSMVSIEAMAMGLPLIVTDVPGNIDIVRDNECGIIVRDKDTRSMADGIQRLASDALLHSKFSNKGLERAKLYSWDNIAKKYLDVYKIAINRHDRT